MSSNNQIIISKEGKGYVIYHDLRVDNEFEFDDEDIIGKAKTMEEAVKIANEFMVDNIVEYGIRFV